MRRFIHRFAIRRTRSDQHKHTDADWPLRAVETCTFSMPPLPPARNAHNVFAIVDHMPLVTTLNVRSADELSRNATSKLQIYGLRSTEGLSQIAREQIRDRERMRTLLVQVGCSYPIVPTVLVEAHFERLVMAEKCAHPQLKVLPLLSHKCSELREN